MRESQLLHDIIRSLYGVVRLWRANVGSVITKDGRRFSSGLPKGFPDLFGILPHKISKTGCPVPVFIECKVGRNKCSPEQAEFIARHKDMGCAAGVARSIEDAWEIIIPFLKPHPERTEDKEAGDDGQT